MKAIRLATAALLSATALAAQQPQPGMHMQGGDQSAASCPHMTGMQEGRMMQGRQMMPGTQEGPMMQGHQMMPGMQGDMMRGMMGGSSGRATPMGQMMMGNGMMADVPWADIMHQTSLFAPQRLLGQADALELSDEQKQQIEQLVTDRAAAGSESQAQQQLKTLLSVERPDLAAVRSAAGTAFGNLATLWSEQVVNAVAVRGILTGEQREQVRQHDPCRVSPTESR